MKFLRYHRLISGRRTTAPWVLGLGAVAATLTVASDASASVSNPDYYYIDVPSGLDSIFEGPSAQFLLMVGQLEGDIASDGSWTYNASAFPQSNTGIKFNNIDVKAQLVVAASGTSGSFLYNAAHDIDMTLRVKIVFTGGGMSQTCQTGFFNVTLSTAKTYTVNGANRSGSAYDTSTGYFRAVASDFTPPAAISTGCDNAANRGALNNAFGFGSGVAGTEGIKFDSALVDNPQKLVP